MSVETATYDTVHSAEGGAKVVAAKMGISHQVLVNKVGLTNDTHHLRLAEAVLLMKVTGDTRIIEALANEFGGIFIRVPELSSNAPANLVGDLANMSAEFGGLMKEVAESVCDGRMTDIELGRVEKEAEALRGALAILLRDLRRLNQTSRVNSG